MTRGNWMLISRVELRELLNLLLASQMENGAAAATAVCTKHI